MDARTDLEQFLQDAARNSVHRVAHPHKLGGLLDPAVVGVARCDGRVKCLRATLYIKHK